MSIDSVLKPLATVGRKAAFMSVWTEDSGRVLKDIALVRADLAAGGVTNRAVRVMQDMDSMQGFPGRIGDAVANAKFAADVMQGSDPLGDGAKMVTDRLDVVEGVIRKSDAITGAVALAGAAGVGTALAVTSR